MTTKPTQTSRVPASVGRIVHVHSNRWQGPRPGIVVNGPFASAESIKVHGSTQLVNVNVFLDGANDASMLKTFRDRPSGNTLCSVPLYDELASAERFAISSEANAAGADAFWCEWPPRS